jgi:PAS domain-containing protein
MKAEPLSFQGEALFKAVLNTVSDAITVIDRDLKVLFQNEPVRKLYGDKVGETCYEAYRGRREPCENGMILDVLKDGKPRRALRDRNPGSI